MATLTLAIPDDLLAEAQTRLGEDGHADLEDYLLSALHALTLEGTPADADTEAKLLEGLASPLEEMTAEDWQSLREHIHRRS